MRGWPSIQCVSVSVIVLAALATQGTRGQATSQGRLVIPPTTVVDVKGEPNELLVEPTAAASLPAQDVPDQASSQEAPAPLSAGVMGTTRESDEVRGGPMGKDDSAMPAVELIYYITIIGASAVGSFVALSGLRAWKRELKGKREMQLAEDVLCLFYRAEWAIKAIRFPFCDLREGQTREVQGDETPEQKNARDRAFVVFKRMRDHSHTFSRLNSLRFRFMARFGRDSAKPFDEVNEILSEISVAAEELAQLWEEQLRETSISESTKKDIKALTGTILSHGKADEVMARMQKAVGNVEDRCKPIIEGRSSWVTRLCRKVLSGNRPEER